jgi:acetyl-CoA carboxylase carboxyl transferase subunit alpha
MISFLEFEKPIAELESKIAELRQVGEGNVDIGEEVGRLQAKADALLRDAYAKLTPWQKAQVARHPNRPHFQDFVAGLVTDYTPLAGDRAFSDDLAILGGMGRLNGRAVMVLGHEKGHDTASRLKHNFGMARPEGYRKAIRLMQLAERFRLPLVTLIDTSGAFPGIEAEARGQGEAIARCTDVCLGLSVPVIACVVGEGGSGGAVAFAAGNKVLMLEHAIYAVISPEGCASILWRSADRAADAADAMKLTAQDLVKLKVIDGIVPEPVGGAHRGVPETIAALKDAVDAALDELGHLSPADLKAKRREKFLEMGKVGL